MSSLLHLLKKVSIFLFLLAMFFIFRAQTTPEIKAVDTSLPSSLSHRLDSLRKADNLEEWLINWMEYLEDMPAARVSYLYSAQSLIWRKAKNDDERLAWFDLLINQGYYELYRGNILRSIEAYEEAYRYYFEKPIPGAEADVLEYVLKPLGNNYTRLGDYDRAFFIHEKSLSLALKLKDFAQVAAVYHNLATAARWKGQFDIAEEYCAKGLKHVKKKTPRHGLLLSTFSEILLLEKKLKEATLHVQEAIKVLEQNLSEDTIDVPYWLRGAYQGYGEILKEKGELVVALKFYEKADEISDKYFRGERKREKTKLCVLSGQALLHLQQPQLAMEKFNLALTILLPSFQVKEIDELPGANLLYAENTIMDALHGKAECLRALGKNEKALDCFMLLFAAERKLRYEFFSNAAKQQQQKENRLWVESAMETGYQLWKSSGKKEYADKILLIAEMSKAQLLMDEMLSNLHYNRVKNADTLLIKQFEIMQAITLYDRDAMLNGETHKPDSVAMAVKKELQYDLSLIQKELKEKYPMLGGYMAEETLPSAGSLLQRIPSLTSVIEFFAGEKNIYIICAKKGAVQQIRKLENAQHLQQVVKDFVFTWFQQGPGKMMNNPQEYYKDAYNIYRWLWEGTAVEKKDRCLVIPDGIIGYLPFDALVTDPHYHASVDQWPFLVRQFEISFTYSLQTWHEQQKINHHNKLFAGFFISFDSSNRISLPAVKKEYEMISNSFSGEYFTGEQASLKKFQENLSKVNLLHISTHSFLMGKENIPVLQLSDDKFFLFELYGKAFQPQLVVLSACRTGFGMLAEGEGVISLARGFTATGAGGIIAGLWNMHDESTAILMDEFYHQLAKDDDPATSLHSAKLQWLDQQHEQSLKKLPYFWAGLIYVGDNQPVKIIKKNSASLKLWWLVGSIACLLILYVIITRKKINHH